MLVDFLEGDPDQPIVTGRTYHANMPLPAGFPKAKPQMDLMSQTHKGDGYNGIMMDDSTNGQRLNLHAQRDMNTIVKNNRSTTVQGNHTETVVGNQSIQVDKNRYKEVMGDESTSIKQNAIITVGKEYKLLVQGNVSIESLENDIKLATAGAQITLSHGGNIDIQGLEIQFNGEAVHLNPRVEDKTKHAQMSESSADGNEEGNEFLDGLMTVGMLAAALATRGKVKPKVGKAALGKANLKNNNVISDGSHISKGRLAPNITYKTGNNNYVYKTDNQGRIIEAQAENLKLTSRKNRLSHKTNTPDKREGDHAGHLFADRFDGSPELDNLVSQAKEVNLGAYKKLENKWAKAIKDSKKVNVNIKVNYQNNSSRPSSFEVKYTIDGIPNKQIIKN